MNKTSDRVDAYIEVALEVPRPHADAVCDFIIDNISNGIVLEEEEGSRYVGIKFYIPRNTDRDFRTSLSTFLSALDSPTMPQPLDVKSRIVKNTSWEDEYRKSVTAITIGDDIVVRPSWDETTPRAKYDIILEPKMAFGTGKHETTRGCLRAVRGYFKPGMRFLDVGCGSGILSILADKMQAAGIKAIDYDPIAADNSLENFRINNTTAPYEIICGSIEICAGDVPYEFVCANIIKSTILEMLERLDALTCHGGILVLSGLLVQDMPDIEVALKGRGLVNFEILTDAEWRTVIVSKG